METYMERTLKEHLTEAARRRWEKATPEARAAHSAKMNKARWPNGRTPKVQRDARTEIEQDGA